jgi:hypothetical protein
LRSLGRLFADVTAVLEDMHGIAVEGQSASTPVDVHTVLVGQLRGEEARLDQLLTKITVVIERRRR